MKEDNIKIPILQIFSESNELIITKINPPFHNEDESTKEYKLNCNEIINRFEDILTEEEKEKLKNYYK
jgi:hypothetical protein